MTETAASTAGVREAPGSQARRTACTLLLLAAVSFIGARILTGPPVYSVNDQSRWSTVRALVDTGTYSIGRRHHRADGSYRDVGIVSEPGWHTIDLVMHPQTFRFYSTKPTLLPTLLAGEYWVLRGLLGWEITRDRHAVSRTILLTINLLPFVLYLVLFARLAERLGSTDWGRLFVFTTAAFGTFVSGFLGSLNNHTVAAIGVLWAVYHCVRIDLDGDRRGWRFVLAGLSAGWAACNELPAASLAAAVALWLLWLSPRKTLGLAIPAMLLPVAAYLSLQYIAFGSVIPTYARTEWYLFPGSYWNQPMGVDRATDPVWLYAFHLLAGHTGILSLTPVLLLAFLGMARLPRSGVSRHGPTTFHVLPWLTLALTVVTFVFYIARTNNYGGTSAGPRWFFWLTPLWLLVMLPEADRWAPHRWRRWLACGLLAISIGSAMYALENPWRHSWLFVVLRDLGAIAYD